MEIGIIILLVLEFIVGFLLGSYVIAELLLKFKDTGFLFPEIWTADTTFFEKLKYQLILIIGSPLIIIFVLGK